MRCAFCQNGDISTDKDNGEESDPRTLAAMAWTLRREGCHNINSVGGEVVIHLHAIVDAIALLGRDFVRPQAPVNVMAQFRPDNFCDPASAKYRDKHAEIARRPTHMELNDSWRRARELGLNFEATTFERRNPSAWRQWLSFHRVLGDHSVNASARAAPTKVFE
jgi:uncharacterized Fe-S radical SAM superfamily protein PflX